MIIHSTSMEREWHCMSILHGEGVELYILHIEGVALSIPHGEGVALSISHGGGVALSIPHRVVCTKCNKRDS